VEGVSGSKYVSSIQKCKRERPPRLATFYLKSPTRGLAIRCLYKDVGCPNGASSDMVEHLTLAYLTCSISATCLSLNMDR
jgi:hypothetical protein